MPAIELTAEQLIQIKQEQLMHAYRELFGESEATRSPTQNAVWNDLQIAGYKKKPIFVADKQGALCPMRAAFADGRRSIILYIESNIEFASDIQQQPKT